jgi:PAS domain S-box-containing protein
MSDQNTDYSKDPRIAEILDLLVKYATGDYSVRGNISEKGDEIDAIMVGLNTIAEEAHSSRKLTQHYLNRIERVMEVLLKYTVMDFSETLEVSGEGDEIDAIAIGLNTLAEELAAARKQESAQLQTISESKEQIETIISNAPSAVVVINEMGDILTWNTKAEEIFGWTLEEVLHKPMHRFIMPERYVDAHYTGLSHFIKTGEGPILNSLIEISAVRKNRQEFPVELAISAVKSKGRYVFIAFIVDISARKKSERELRQANKMLEDSNSELEAFTYSVSHDLRAPLRALNGYSQLLVERYSGALDEQAKGYIAAIATNTKRMGRLIDDLLSLSRYSRAQLERSDVNMNDVVTAVIEELENGMDLSKVDFKIDKLPHSYADYSLILQIYSNLISNAVKYSSLKEKPVVHIGATVNEKETVFFVKDNGSGFDMQFYDKLFGVFQRLHDSSEFEGTGVGLAIVQRIITKHGGRIWAESKIDEGSSFYFTLQ